MRRSHVLFASTVGAAILGGAVATAVLAGPGARPTAILFISNRDGAANVYATSLDGRRIARLTTRGAVSTIELGHALVPSPDGRRILFERWPTDGDRDTWVVNADGTGEQHLFRGVQPVWSPDGGRIAFTVAARWTIHVARADGKGIRPVADGDGRLGFAWSPDGARLVFAREDGLYTVRADGSDEQRLLDEPFVDSPVWLSSGKILFGCSAGLCVLDADGTDRRRVPGVGVDYAVSPDGRRIAFTRGSWLSITNLNGTGQRRLARADRVRSEPAWSPDGRWISFVRGDAIHVVGADGRGERKITTGRPHEDEAPAWTTAPVRLREVPGGFAVPTEAIAADGARTDGTITQLIADGDWVAAAVDYAGIDAAHAVLWNTRGATLTRVGPGRWGGSGETIDEPIALAGGRLAWTEVSGGHHEVEVELLVASARRQAPVTAVDKYASTAGVGCPFANGSKGLVLGDLQGEGRLLVYTTCEETEELYVPYTREKILHALGRPLALSIPLDAAPVAVDGERIVLRRRNGAITVISSRGRRVRGFRRVHALEAQLDGNRLVTLAPGRLASYELGSGRLERTWRVGRGTRLADAEAGVAAIISGRTIRLISLAGDRSATVRVPGGGTVYAQLSPSDLYYAHKIRNGPFHGRISSAPLARLLG
jgi:hypothetical protein